MALELKLTLNPDDDMTSHAALLRRVATALETRRGVSADEMELLKVEPAAPAPTKLAPAPKSAPAKAEPAPAKRGPGRPPKAKPAPAPAPSQDENGDEVDDDTGEPWEPRRNERAAAATSSVTTETEVDLDDDDLGVDLEDETETAGKPALSYEKDIIPALRAYGKKHGRPKVEALLKSLKVGHARDIPEDKYEEVMAKLKK